MFKAEREAQREGIIAEANLGFGGVSQSVRPGFRKRGRCRTFEAEREA